MKVKCEGPLAQGLCPGAWGGPRGALFSQAPVAFGPKGGAGATLASEVNAKLTFMAYRRPKRRRALADVAQNLTRPFDGKCPVPPGHFFWWRGRHVVPKKAGFGKLPEVSKVNNPKIALTNP